MQTPSNPSTPPVPVMTPEAMIDTFIAKQLPGWLRAAAPGRIRVLAECFKAHAASGQALATLSGQLVSAHGFAEQQFGPLLSELIPDCPALASLEWLEVRRRFGVPQGIGLPRDEIDYVRFPALLRLMQGFSSDATFYVGSGVTTVAGTQLLHADVDRLVADVRALDAGEQYQAYLGRLFTPQAEALLASHQRTGFALACELGLVNGRISADERVALNELLDPGHNAAQDHLQAYAGELRMLGCTVANGLKVQLRGPSGEEQGVVLYLPSLQTAPLQRFDSLTQMNTYLVGELLKADVHRHFRELVSLADRPRFINTLDLRLKDDEPDLELEGAVADGDVFTALARAQVQRYKDDGQLMLVPNAQADHRATEQRLKRWQQIGWGLLGLVGLAVPTVGVVLFGKTVLDTLGEVYEGAVDWSAGHQHEAMAHMLHVAETVAVTAATVVGIGAVARSFKGSAFVDALQPVTVPEHGARLWSDDLRVYESTPDRPRLQDNGLYAVGERRWMRVGEHYYEVHRPAPNLAWRLRHPRGEGAFEPLVEHNGERFWRLRLEHPLEWDDSREMLARLWPHDPPLTAEQADRILKVAGVDKEELRGVLVENRPAPVNLRDTLRRFEADARLSTLFQGLRLPGAVLEDAEVLQWCRSRADMQGLDEAAVGERLVEQQARLQGALLDHLSSTVAPDDGLLALVRRDFPGLVLVYAQELLRDVEPEVRAQALLESRLPFSLGQKARALLELSRANRAIEGLYLRTGHSQGTGELVMALLRRLPGWPSALNLELREGSENGRLLAILDPQGPSSTRVVLSARDGQYRLHDSRGLEREEEVAEPGGIFQALAALLSETDRAALRFDDGDLAEQLRTALQALLPARRSAVLARLGWRRASTPWFNPGRRLPDGRVGYPLGGQVSRSSSSTLRGRIRALYPGFSDEEVERYVQRLQRDHAWPIGALLEQEQNYVQLDEILQQWESQGSEAQIRGRRAQFANRLRAIWRYEGDVADGGQVRADGMRLDVSGWRIGRLPDLPVEIDFSHVTELVMVNMELTEVRGNFLRCFESLRVLNLNRNRLDTLPPGVTQLASLRTLLLMSNRIRMTATDQRILASLSGLSTLDLGFNPIRRINMRFDQLPQLSELRMSRCGLLDMPAGIEYCGLLNIADLSHNDIQNVPEAVALMPWSFRRRLNLIGNPLGLQSMERLYRVDAHPAVRIEDAGQGDEGSQGVTAIARWLAISGEDEQTHSLLWRRLEALPGSSGLFRLLEDVTHIPDFTRAPDHMSAQLWPLLEAIDEDEVLREEIFLHADEVRGCHDSHAERFSRLQIHLLTARARSQGSQGMAGERLLTLGRQLFRLDRLDEHAAQDAAQRARDRLAGDPEIDVLEVVLGYRSALAAALDLPHQPRYLRFDGLADITQAREQAALAVVRAAEATDALARSISRRDFWRAYLEQRHGAAFAVVAENYANLGTELDEQVDVLTSEDYAQRWNALRTEREAAEDALALRLTQDALGRVGAGERLDPGESAQAD
ncbi:NEL-type E3 ubiquitin ligase domain-containing protein [Pseudomonas entomophila]|uniref:NEL-type E3 ubiquitin ligase domain-containing protein n=1 Tax=Pseudomonas entomophila TaxID=312306 RepID=UPI002404DECF|nr:NEL-type E3 ubiquitin ligase domain-containing protein [Pseudomonas entomophila]MDF9619128.1 NEL-type E3 ubiquitin ligase domain-containing protein [Pseudomonas entomophila]